ncbi:hypothetical protein [Microcoleus sp. FACHB-SPT15]|nr:hypothetical protein [Microcoleus sp. FACHB-SPT15]
MSIDGKRIMVRSLKLYRAISFREALKGLGQVSALLLRVLRGG